MLERENLGQIIGCFFIVLGVLWVCHCFTPALLLNTALLINEVACVAPYHYRSVQQRLIAKRFYVQEDTQQILDDRQTNLNVLVI